MTGTYDSWLVLLSLILSVGVSFVALNLAARVYFVTIDLSKYWLIGGGIGMGLGIWSMHFVGMLAFNLPIPVAYDIPLTLVSILLSILASILALFTVRKGSNEIKYLLLSAFLMGSGIAAMHYTGMAAMDMFPPIQYKLSLVFVSLVIAYVASYITLKLSFKASAEKLVILSARRFFASVVMGLGIASMHYTAMYAAIFSPGSVCRAIPNGLTSGTISLFVVLGVVIILLFTFLILVFELKLSEKDRNLLETLKLHNEELLIRSNKLAQKMTDELRESARKDRLLATIAEQSADAIITRDMDGMILSSNLAAEQMFGYLSKDIVGACTEIFCVDKDCFYAKNPEYESQPYETTRKYEIKLKTEDGREIDVLSHVSPLLNSENELIGEISILRDITESKRAEEERKRLQHELQQAHKMEALGNLTGGIAHDFNNLLGVIMGYSEILQDKLSNDPKVGKYVDEIYRAGERGSKLTAKLLAFSRNERISAEVVDINTVLKDQQHLLEKTLTVRIKLIIKTNEKLWPVCIDKASLEDAILNMSINALHAMSTGGSFILDTRNEHLGITKAQQIDIEPGDYVLLSLTDTGTGMDEVTLQQIFDPFFSTKDGMGTGLGMSQVYGFVKQSQGTIRIKSEPGHGTQITIYLPRYIEHRTTALEQEITAPVEIAAGNETILVVEDEVALLELAEEILATHGYRVLCAEGGTQALEILKTETVDLLLTDVIMPGMDGYQLATKVEELYPDIKIQMVSGFSDDYHVDQPNEELYHQQLQKPISSAVLLQRIRNLLDEKVGQAHDLVTKASDELKY
ncbi:MAG: response regulator [Gammaproteobacteria bacterium]|nr:response regulator [Gammaproteobacteria bacterium]